MYCAMSCNIRFTNPNDGENNWPHRKEFVRELILENRADIIGTQEGREPQLRELEELLQQHTLIDQHREWIEERMYPCLFIKKELFEIITSGDIWLSETPYQAGSRSFDSAFPRLCTYAHLRDKKNNKELLVVNCHLDHVKEETRVGQIQVLIQEVEKLNIKAPLLLMGDFNSSPISTVREILISKKKTLKDPWLIFGHPEETSFHKFDGLDPDGSKTRIDWILSESPVEFHSIELIKENRNGRYPSDHFFVAAKFKLDS